MISGRVVMSAVVMLLLFPCFSSLADEPAAPATIVEIQEKLATARGEVEQLLGTQVDIYDQLDKLEAELELSSTLLRELRRHSRLVASQIEATTDTILRLSARTSTETLNLAAHLRNFLKHGRRQEVFIPFASQAGFDRSRHDYLFRRLIAHDQMQLLELNISLAGHERLLDDLKKRKAELTALTRAERVEEQSAQEAVRQRDKLLARVKGEQRQKLREMRELEESSHLLGDIVAALDLQRHQTMDTVWQTERELSLRMKGKLQWPVHGKIIAYFGTRRDTRTGFSVKNNGINIAAAFGTKVVAALTGEVLYIGWARGLDRFVVVDHGGSLYSLYGNLDQLLVSEGDQVVRGEEFAATAGGRLHFEVRNGESPVDPLEWLRK